MSLSLLKPLRVVVSLIVLFLTLYLFTDLSGHLSGKLVRAVLFFQIVPSAVALFHVIAFSALGCLFILLLTLLFWLFRR